MSGMSLIEGLLILWAIVSGTMMVLLTYRSTLGSHAEDQVYLSRAEDVLDREHEQTLKKEKKLVPILYALGTASGVLLLSIGGVWLWQGLLET